MQHNEDAFATLLLMSQVTPEREELVIPLSIGEYYTLQDRVREAGLPGVGALIDLDMSGMSLKLNYSDQEAYRLVNLLSRTLPISVSLERFYDANIDVMTVEDRPYPRKLEKMLRRKAPPMLYFSGRPELLRQPAIAVLGTGAPRGDAHDRVRELVAQAVDRGYTVITDGAQGLSRIAEEEALALGGRVVNVLADGLFECATGDRESKAVAERQMLLLSIEHPDAVKTHSHARARNKLIYALSEAAFIFSADELRGATWDGATEALLNGYCGFIYVWDTDLYGGNRPLIARGAHRYLSEEHNPFAEMRDRWQSANAEQLSLFLPDERPRWD